MARRVLVVDDESDFVLALDHRMRREGYEVERAADGVEALERIRAARPDGYAVCKRVRVDPALCDVRIVMPAAKGRGVECERGLALGADGYFTEPFSTREVVERVRELLGEPREAR